jgi:hypothetical protein
MKAVNQCFYPGEIAFVDVGYYLVVVVDYPIDDFGIGVFLFIVPGIEEM